jgi:hypothetical protein
MIKRKYNAFFLVVDEIFLFFCGDERVPIEWNLG